MRHSRNVAVGVLLVPFTLLLLTMDVAAQQAGFTSADLFRLKSVADVHVSPDGTRVAYSVVSQDRPGRPYSQVWIMDVADATSRRLGSDKEPASNPRWSPDGKWIAYFGRDEDHGTLMVSRPDGTEAVQIATVQGTNHPLPSSGDRLTWSPDGKSLAFVSATPRARDG